MVEQKHHLDAIFTSLADPTRRDILGRVALQDLSISEVAFPYPLTFAAISKHIMLLERAGLVSKRREGKKQIIRIVPHALKEADAFLRQYEKTWATRLDRLGKHLQRTR